MEQGYPRKRRRTRRRLLRAGLEVLAEHGPSGVTAGHVAEVADVAVGTFYNHFPTVDSLFDAISQSLGRGIEIGRETLADIEHDPVRRVAIGVLQLLDLAEHDPIASQAFVSLTAVRPDFRTRIRGVVAGAIADGVEVGAFAVDDLDAATNAVLGSTLQSMRSRVLGETDATVAPHVATLVLRLLGTSTRRIEPAVRAAVAAAAPDPTDAEARAGV